MAYSNIIHGVHTDTLTTPKLTKISRLNSPSIFSESRFRAQKQRFACRIVLELPVQPGYSDFPVGATICLEVRAHVPTVDSGYQSRDRRWQSILVVLLAL